MGAATGSGSDATKKVLMKLHHKVILDIAVLGCIAKFVVFMHKLSRYHQNISDLGIDNIIGPSHSIGNINLREKVLRAVLRV